MLPHIHRFNVLEYAKKDSTAIVSRMPYGDPEISIIQITASSSGETRCRALVGWLHTDDTDLGRRGGKLWAWVASDRFEVYDQPFNRSPVPGEARFCGRANFTMIRMFHPYWARTDGLAPRDMYPPDKSRCRWLYGSLIARDRQARGWAVDDEWEDPEEPDWNKQEAEFEARTRRQMPSEGRCGNRSGGRGGRKGVCNGRNQSDFALRFGPDRVVSGGSKKSVYDENNPLALSDDENDIEVEDCDTEGISIDVLLDQTISSLPDIQRQVIDLTRDDNDNDNDWREFIGVTDNPIKDEPFPSDEDDINLVLTGTDDLARLITSPRCAETVSSNTSEDNPMFVSQRDLSHSRD